MFLFVQLVICTYRQNTSCLDTKNHLIWNNTIPFFRIYGKISNSFMHAGVVKHWPNKFKLNKKPTSRAKSFCFMHGVKENNYSFVHFFKYNSWLINNSRKFSWVSLDTHQYNTMQVNSNDMKILRPYKICIIKLTPNGWGKMKSF